MPNAIRFHKSGGPEVLVSEPVPIGKPGPGEARVRIDTPKEADYFRHGGILPYVLRSLMGGDA